MTFIREYRKLRQSGQPPLSPINSWGKLFKLVEDPNPYTYLVSKYLTWDIFNDSREIEFKVDGVNWNVNYEYDIVQFGINDRMTNPDFFFYDWKGDCEDSAIALASCLEFVGIEYSIVTGWLHQGQGRGKAYHAWLECKIDGRWFAQTFGKGKLVKDFYTKSDGLWMKPDRVVMPYLGRMWYWFR